MEKEEVLIEKFGLCPLPESANEIRKLLKAEIESHDNNEGCGEYLRVLCFMLFYLGNIEDSELIWKAKMLNMDTGAMVDVGLLCGAGYQPTLEYILPRIDLIKMKAYLEKYGVAADEVDRTRIIDDFKRYYGCF